METSSDNVVKVLTQSSRELRRERVPNNVVAGVSRALRLETTSGDPLTSCQLAATRPVIRCLTKEVTVVVVVVVSGSLPVCNVPFQSLWWKKKKNTPTLRRSGKARRARHIGASGAAPLPSMFAKLTYDMNKQASALPKLVPPQSLD